MGKGLTSWLIFAPRGRFEPTTGRVNWPRIAAASISKIERGGDLQTLGQFLPDVAVGRVDAEDIDATNPGLINAFRLAQLQTQYVLHCQQVSFPLLRTFLFVLDFWCKRVYKLLLLRHSVNVGNTVDTIGYAV